ncbi:hypothetical protein FJZ53_04395 [Candidatus Woesearchaeota archaeon]|nr:hypothetical protein [Candidatus Woesearchaeota archaeon]
MTKPIKDEKYWEEFGRQMGRKFGESKAYSRTYHFTGGSTLALLLFLIGLYWVARDLGLVEQKISIWALIFTVVGGYWFLKSLFRRY